MYTCTITYTQTNKCNHTHNPLCIRASCDACLFNTDDPSILTNPSSSSTDPSSSSTNKLILSVEELILALPIITDPVGFGIRLGVGYNRCEELIINQGSNNAQVRAIAAEWYRKSHTSPTWNKVVEALYKFGLVRDAVDLASKVGVKSPLDDDSDHR